jgi:hypothetical protein
MVRLTELNIHLQNIVQMTGCPQGIDSEQAGIADLQI